jgi:hypothetical protein
MPFERYCYMTSFKGMSTKNVGRLPSDANDLLAIEVGVFVLIFTGLGQTETFTTVIDEELFPF